MTRQRGDIKVRPAMVELRDAIAFTIFRHPCAQGELSESTLLKLLFLAEVSHASTYRHRLTAIRWFKTGFGAYTDAIAAAALEAPDDFHVQLPRFAVCKPGHVISLRPTFRAGHISPHERMSIEHAVAAYGHSRWDVVTIAVAKTDPMHATPPGSEIDVRQKFFQLFSDDIDVDDHPLQPVIKLPRRHGATQKIGNSDQQRSRRAR